MKKTLFISRYSPPIIGGPQNMYTLMRNLPVASYIMLTSFYNIDSTSAKTGTWLPGRYFFYDNPTASIDSAKVPNTSIENKGRTFITKLKSIAKQSVIISTLIGVPIIFVQLFEIIYHGKRIIKKERIETLMGFSDYGSAMIGTYVLHKLTKKPYIIFLFDVYKGNTYPFPGNTLAKVFEKRIIENASKIVVTNTTTAELYEKRYGHSIREKTTVIHNSTPASYKPNEVKFKEPTKPYSIVFTGSIYWAQIGALKNLVDAIDDTDIHLKIYSPTPESVLRQNGLITNNVEFLGSAPFRDMPKIQGSADLLFLPLAWNTKSQVIIDTATPGKFTDYLIAGRPMLVHAPKTSCVVKYSRENNCAIIVDENDPSKLRKKLNEFFQNPIKIGDYLVKNAQEFYSRNYSVKKNEELFRSIL